MTSPGARRRSPAPRGCYGRPAGSTRGGGLLTGELRGIIADCLAKDPGARPGTGDLLARFGRLAQRHPAVTAGPALVPAVVPPPGAQLILAFARRRVVPVPDARGRVLG